MKTRLDDSFDKKTQLEETSVYENTVGKSFERILEAYIF